MRGTSRSGRVELVVVFLAMLAVVGVLAVVPGAGQPPAGVKKEAAKAGAAATTVRLVVDYGDGVQKVFVALPWKSGMMVLDAMNAGKAHARGITFESTSTGERALLTKIDDLANEGSGETKKNWQFLVNGKMAERGMGAVTLKAGDRVRWVFDLYKDPKAKSGHEGGAPGSPGHDDEK